MSTALQSDSQYRALVAWFRGEIIPILDGHAEGLVILAAAVQFTLNKQSPDEEHPIVAMGGASEAPVAPAPDIEHGVEIFMRNLKAYEEEAVARGMTPEQKKVLYRALLEATRDELREAHNIRLTLEWLQ